MSVKWVILDAMGVIFIEGHDLHELLIPFIKKRNNKIPENFIQEIYIEASLGKITSYELWEKLGFREEYPEIEKKYLDTWLRIDPEFIEIAEKLKKNYSLALLSNDVKEWSQYLRKKYDIDKYFDLIVISGEVYLRKPDIEIFRLILKKMDIAPEKCIFIDDNLYNLKPAAELGIKTIRFVRKKYKIPFCSEFEISNFLELISILKNFYRIK